jgi:hypothetical protein
MARTARTEDAEEMLRPYKSGLPSDQEAILFSRWMSLHQAGRRYSWLTLMEVR